MKVQLLKGETKATFGTGENSFDYWYRPLTLEEKQNVNSHIVWKTAKGKTSVDIAMTDLTELLRLSVTRFDRLYDSDDAKVDNIEKFLSLQIDAGYLQGAIFAIWVEIWTSTMLPEETKKKLSRDSTPTGTE